MKQYYYLTPDRKQEGPVTEAELRSLLAAGVVTPNTLVACVGMSAWLPLSTILSPTPLGPFQQTGAPRYTAMSCWGYIVSCITEKYAVFSGRATRKEYWSYQFFMVIPSAIFGFFWGWAQAGSSSSLVLSLLILTLLGVLALCIPSWAVTVRRLHDCNQSGWLALLQLIPYVGCLVVAIICLQDSHRGTNQYGPSEKYPG